MSYADANPRRNKADFLFDEFQKTKCFGHKYKPEDYNMYATLPTRWLCFIDAIGT